MRLHWLVPVLLTAAACGGDATTDENKSAPRNKREVAIRATDELRFDPQTVSAKPGETITFVVTNTGRTDHEFVIGDADYQSGHDSAGGHGGHGDGTGAAEDVPAGETVRVTFTMPDEPPVYVCHLNNHDDAGMKGSVTYA